MRPNILPLEKLPRLMWSTEIAGHVTAEAAAETGLAIGTPVTCGTIDAAAEAVSVGVKDAGEMMMMYGSTIFIIQVTAKPVRDARLWYAPWLFPGTHASMAGLATSGTLTHWFRDQLARDTDFPTLVAEAQESPKGAKGLLCLPYFSGERTPIHDPHARGAFFGLNLTHTRADMFRAVVEGIAAGTAHVMEALRKVDWPCHAVIITSDKCYDNVEWVWGYRETDALGGKDIYSGSKGAAELIFRSYFHSFFQGKNHSVRLATARAGNVIGGGDWAANRIVADCIRAWGDGKTVEIDHGEQRYTLRVTKENKLILTK